MSDGKEAKVFSLIAMIVSALSFAAASGQTWLMYEHNRLSVKPKLDWRVAYGDGARLEVSLINAGLGPAKVSDIKIGINSAIYPLTHGQACNVLDGLIGADPEAAKGADCFAMDADDWAYVKPGDTLVLYTSGTHPDIDTYPVDQLGVSAKYCSLYDQCEGM